MNENEPVFFLLSKRFHMIWISQIVVWLGARLAELGLEIPAEELTGITNIAVLVVVWAFGMFFGKRGLSLLPKSMKGGGATLSAFLVLLVVFGGGLLTACGAAKTPQATVVLGNTYHEVSRQLVDLINADRLSPQDVQLAAATRHMVRQSLDRSRCAGIYERHASVEPATVSPFAAEWQWCVDKGFASVAGTSPGAWAADARAGIEQLRRIIEQEGST